MGMKADLVTRLAGDAAISAIVNTALDTEEAISWHGFQRGDNYPAIMLTMITPGEEWTHDGVDPIERPRVRFDIRGADADVLETLSVAIKAEMRGAADVSDTRFHPAMLEAERTINLDEQDGGELLFQVQLEFMFYHEEI